MANEFLKTGGRDREGLARGLKTNKEGNLTTVDAYTVLQNEVTYQADGKSVYLGTPRMCGPFDVQGMDQLFVSLISNGAHTWEIWIHEIILSNDRKTERVINSFRANDRVYSANQTFTVPINSALIKVELREITISGTSSRLSALYLAARKNPQPYKSTQALNQNYLAVNEKAILMDEVNHNSQGQWVEVGASRKTPLLDVRAYDRIQFYLTGNGAHTWELWVHEIIKNEIGNQQRVVNSFRVGNKVYSANQVLEFDISSPFIELEFKEITSVDSGRLVAFYIVGSKKGSNTKETIIVNDGNEIVSPDSPPVMPYPNFDMPKLKNIKFIDTTIKWVHTFKDGLFYGSKDATIYTSEDGTSWQKLRTIPTVANNGIAKLLISDTGRLIACMGNGEIWRTDESQGFGTGATYKTGNFSHYYGSTQHGNVIGVTTYETAGLETAKKHEAWLSTDNGATFKKIFDKATLTALQPNNDGRMHLHDIEYDPYSGAIYIWNGDFGNAILNYSTDMGNTWSTMDPTTVNGNTTQLIATKTGIALGGDTYGGGIEYVRLDRSKLLFPNIKEEDISTDYWKFNDGLEDGESGSRYIAYKKYVNRDEGIYLIPYKPEYLKDGDFKTTYIVYSPDGISWSVLWRGYESGHLLGFDDIVYGNGKLIGAYNFKEYEADSERKLFVADMEI